MRCPRWVHVFLAVLLVGVISGAVPALAERRAALVIGNSAYVHALALANPRHDAEALSAVLERLGFEVTTGFDLDRAKTEQVIREFSAKLKGADVGLLFYAGHGLQVRGQNYLLPIDARLADENDLEFEAVELDRLLRIMERSASINIVFLDACRDNPLAQNLARSMGNARSTAVGRGLALATRGVGTLIAYATQPDNVALDGTGEHSPFAAALLQNIETPGLEVRALLTRVRSSVLRATEGKQQPWDHSSLTTEFYFRLGDATTAAASPPASMSDATAIELAFWDSIKDSANPANFEAYLAQYPAGSFAPLARVRLDELKKAPSEPTSQVAILTPTSEPTPEQAEQALKLSLDSRSEVQRALTLLGYETYGFDGNFGAITRRAIAAWQSSRGIRATGFLTSDQQKALLEEGAPGLVKWEEKQRQAALTLLTSSWKTTTACPDSGTEYDRMAGTIERIVKADWEHLRNLVSKIAAKQMTISDARREAVLYRGNLDQINGMLKNVGELRFDGRTLYKVQPSNCVIRKLEQLRNALELYLKQAQMY